MDKQNEFVAKRLGAHAAGTADVARDPLVMAALADQAAARAVMERWARLREELKPVRVRTHRRYTAMLRRQAE